MQHTCALPRCDSAVRRRRPWCSYLGDLRKTSSLFLNFKHELRLYIFMLQEVDNLALFCGPFRVDFVRC